MDETVLVVIGTRPEAIKIAPLVCTLQRKEGIQVHLCLTGQHREMVDEVLRLFELSADTKLSAMQPGQSLNGLHQRLVGQLETLYAEVSPDVVVVHGDTATCFAAATTAFQNQVPVVHVEAGLRTGNISAPWPEEAYRRMVAVIAARHYAPTETTRNNLLKEGVREDDIALTGNTVIDALLWMRQRLKKQQWKPSEDGTLHGLRSQAKLILVTAHRRENFGEGIFNISHAVARLSRLYPELDFVYPVHPNPNIGDVVRPILSGIDNVFLTAPLDYPHFVWLMDRASLVLTDSGGVQEEAPSLNKPVLVLRDSTERTEALCAGTICLVGKETETIVAEAVRLLDEPRDYAAMAERPNPYGDGNASKLIADDLALWLKGGVSK